MDSAILKENIPAIKQYLRQGKNPYLFDGYRPIANPPEDFVRIFKLLSRRTPFFPQLPPQPVRMVLHCKLFVLFS